MTSFPVQIDPFSLVSAQDPYPSYRQLRDESPCHWLNERNLWVVSRYDDTRRVMGNAASFTSQAMATAVTTPGRYAANRVAGTDETISIIGTDGDEHTRLRKILNRAFTPRRIETLRKRATELADEFLTDAMNAGRIDLQIDFADRLPVAVIAELFGVEPERHGDFRRWAEAMLLAVFGSPTEAEAHGITQSLTEMNDWLDSLINDRGLRRDRDVISLLLDAEGAEDGLTHSEMKTFVFTVLVAGSITTAFLIGNGIVALNRHPQALDRLVNSPSMIPSFVEEILRHDAPAQIMVRTAAHDTEICGTQIHTGDTIAVVLGSANRDDRMFADADQFRLDRGSNPHLGFGYGAHYCLGAALARLEGQVAFERLAKTGIAIDVCEPVEYLESEFFRGPKSIVVKSL